MNEEYKKPCDKGCLNHKYHCCKCNTAVSYSPANYASRPQDIPNWCEYCLSTPSTEIIKEQKDVK